MTCAQLQTKKQISIAEKICCIKSGFQILYPVEQYSSLFLKDKLKQGAHIHQTHDLPSLQMSWENCHAVPSQQLHMCCVELALDRLLCTHLGRKRFLRRGFSNGFATLMVSNKGETAVCGCHCPREVLARPWVGVCVPLACFKFASFSMQSN